MEKFITAKEMEQRRADIAKSQGLEDSSDVRCYHCQEWGYNRGGVMTSTCRSRCSVRKGFTDSYCWCKRFKYVGNGTK